MAIKSEIDEAIRYFERLLQCADRDCAHCEWMDYDKGCLFGRSFTKRHNELALAALRMTKNMARPLEGTGEDGSKTDGTADNPQLVKY